MKPYLNSMLFGAIASAILLMAGFWVGTRPDLIWLGRLAFGPGDSLFPYARRIGLLSAGEGNHHLFVLLASLLTWAIAFGFTVRVFLYRSKGDVSDHTPRA
jgi:hypothetical protein